MTTPSNQTGLRIAEEASLKTLPGTPVWHPYEPDAYGDFGGETKTEARSPIDPSRQRRKGAVIDQDAAAGFNQDFTTSALDELMQGFMFASWRKKDELEPTAVTSAQYTVASGGAAFDARSLLFATGFVNAQNNGLKVPTSATATAVSVSGLTSEVTAGTTITRVGYNGASGDLDLDVTGGVATLNSAAGDLSVLGLIPGEWVWLGGDATANQFATSANNGLYRISTISASAIVFDRAPDNVATDAGTGKTIYMFFGHVIKNESDPALQVLRTYQAERKIDTNEWQYILGCGADELKVEVKTASKITLDVSLVALDEEFETAAKSGTRPVLPEQTVMSAATDYTRLRLLNDETGAALAGFMTDLEFTVKNGLEADKAIGSIGGIGFSFGDFMVSGSVEAYFSTSAAVAAVKANTDVAIDQTLVANVQRTGEPTAAVGWTFDLPRVSLGDARAKVEKDKAIKLPLSYDAVAHDTFDHTMLAVKFPYLPQLAV